MKKPLHFWRWDALKSWILGGGRKRKRAATRYRRIWLEPLSPRIVLAGDVGADTEQVPATESSTAAEVAAIDDANRSGLVATEVQSAPPDSEAASDKLRSGSASNTRERNPRPRELDGTSNERHAVTNQVYDVNDDQRVTPIDVLLVANAWNAARVGRAADLELERVDINGDGQFSEHDYRPD